MFCKYKAERTWGAPHSAASGGHPEEAGTRHSQEATRGFRKHEAE